ncbi:DNA cytosine methyltransferase [Arthrobacter crusticola]|uniref:Cytosine-specific methyltransferase n=1 Tax=Arthrobacter crusticola TaxID=2547960 RepID=A0A4R5TZ82_9MICC|nr:DNA cytosine methyltransferase [Arthrobacter crusticola]TDK26587.1 DNA cytosine methyltransferase [Arthrobacter crusticola]
MNNSPQLSVLEICAGAGGQSVGLEKAGFTHSLAVEIDVDAASTLRLNRPEWDVHTGDVREISGTEHRGVDLLAGGVPCPPFSIAGKQLGADDERDLFPEALRLVREARPTAVLLENVKGLASVRFAPYRQSILTELDKLGYDSDWKLLNSSEYGVPQLRPRFILVAMKRRSFKKFEWPLPQQNTPTVGELLQPLMESGGWAGANAWALRANSIAPTVVGGSKKHGGADLGPTRAKAAWLQLGVDGKGIANEPPSPETPLDYTPRLTNQMVARVQGFPAEWKFSGRKTSVYRQIGNAFPPPVASAIGNSIAFALGAGRPIEKYDIKAIDESLEKIDRIAS